MTRDNDTLVREFVDACNTKDSDQLAPYLQPDVVFHAYGDNEILGHDAAVAARKGVFANVEQIQFSTVHQAVNNDIVIAEHVHGLGLPGRKIAPVMTWRSTRSATA
jgi:limonene-1,2-epoxide hydrolase